MHIPKCGGKGFQNLVPILEKSNLPVFIQETKPFVSFNDYAYINAHYGTLPMIDTVDTVCLVRDPLDRLISQFAWAMMKGEYFIQFKKYHSGKIEDLLRYFLFEDEEMKSNNNLQAKFICNPFISGIFKRKHIENPQITEEEMQDINKYFIPKIIETEWLIKNDNTSIENVKKQIDKMFIVDTIENYSSVIDKVCNWFKENYQLDVEQEFKDSLSTDTPTFNYSSFIDSEGIEWTTAKLKTLLTPEEITKVYENNSIDLEAYNYVKSR
jgi:hypothetical protein